jgi:hypothetical protein
MREHEYADLGVAAADLLGGDEAVIASVWGHADIDECDVGAARVDHAYQLVGVAAAPSDLEAGVLEQAGESVAQQDLVIGDHDAHGSSARNC